MEYVEGQSVPSVEYLSEAFGTDSTQPTNFTIKFPDTSAEVGWGRSQCIIGPLLCWEMHFLLNQA